jgi:hypothetical protein
MNGDVVGANYCALVFAHDVFVQLVAIPDSVFKLTVILRQSFDNDVRASRNVLVKRRFEKNDFSDLKFVCHDALPLNKPNTMIVHHQRGEIKTLIGV